MVNNFKTQPKTTAVKIFGFLSVMSSVYLYNKLEDDEDFKKVDPYLKDNYWLMNTGLKNKGRPYYISVAGLPRSGVVLWQPIRQAIDYYVEKNPDKKEEMKKNLAETFTSSNIVKPFLASMLPPALKTPIEMASNYDLFRQRNIEPTSTENLSPELRSRPSTPNVYRRMAQGMANMPLMGEVATSPAKMAHMASGMAPAVRQIEGPIDAVLDKLLGTDNLLDPMSKDDATELDKVSKVIPFIKATHYDPELEDAYKQLRTISTDRRDRVFLAKQYYDKWKAGDEDSEAKFRIIYRNLDRQQRQTIEQYKKKRKLENRLGKAQYKIKKAPLAVRRALSRGYESEDLEDIFKY